MKIGIIGNSHIAALKQGWDLIKEEYGNNVEIVFFGARRSRISGLKLVGNKLVSTNEKLSQSLVATSGGLSEITLNEYDVIIIHALGFDFVSGKEAEGFSSGFMALTDLSCFQKSLLMETLNKVKAKSTRKIILGHTPLKAEKCADDVAQSLSSRVNLINRYLADDKIVMVPQPESTLASACSTKPEFTSNSMRLDVGLSSSTKGFHGPEDVVHMNADFGRDYMIALLAECLKG